MRIDGLGCHSHLGNILPEGVKQKYIPQRSVSVLGFVARYM
jgi:hypothetical protein